MLFRIATFNAENLFSRARIINLADHALSKSPLDEVNELDGLLKTPKYSAPNKTRIATLLKALKDYVAIRENRGKLLARTGKVTAAGAGDWDREIAFKLDKFTSQQRRTTAEVLRSVHADVQCMVEIENLDVLRRYSADFALGFAYPLLIDALDPRGTLMWGCTPAMRPWARFARTCTTRWADRGCSVGIAWRWN